MGMDINFFIEQKMEGEWVAVDIPEQLMPRGRDYVIYGIFGVGQYSDTVDLCPIRLDGRGLPPDSKIFLGSDYAAITHAYLDELMQINWNYWNYEEGEDGVSLGTFPLENSYFRAFITYILPRWFDLYTDVTYRDIRVIVAFSG